MLDVATDVTLAVPKTVVRPTMSRLLLRAILLLVVRARVTVLGRLLGYLASFGRLGTDLVLVLY